MTECLWWGGNWDGVVDDIGAEWVMTRMLIFVAADE